VQPVYHSHHRIGHSLFIVGAFLLLLFGTILTPMSSGSTRAFGISDVVSGSNQARAQLNKKPLTSNAKLMTAAQMKAEDMAKGHFFAHTAPDGTVAWDYFKKVGYSYEVAGENLAITNESSDAIIQGWLNSPTHRDNLLNSQYADMGIGMASFGDYQGHKGTYVVVAFYGKRADSQAIAATTNPAGGTTNFKPRLMPVSPEIIASIAIILMAIGVALELRHIRRVHHSKKIA